MLARWGKCNVKNRHQYRSLSSSLPHRWHRLTLQVGCWTLDAGKEICQNVTMSGKTENDGGLWCWSRQSLGPWSIEQIMAWPGPYVIVHIRGISVAFVYSAAAPLIQMLLFFTSPLPLANILFILHFSAIKCGSGSASCCF